MKPSKTRPGGKTLYVPESNPYRTGVESAYGLNNATPGPGGTGPGGTGLGLSGLGISNARAAGGMVRPKGVLPKETSQTKVDTIFNGNTAPVPSSPDVNAPVPEPLPPQCEADPLIKCIAGLLSNMLPANGGQGGNGRGRRVTKDIYVGIPCNADRCCIDKFLGKAGAGCCPPSCAQKCCPPCGGSGGGGGCGGGSCGTGGCGGGSCGVQKCCCPPVCGAPKCCPTKRGRRYRRRGRSQKSQQQPPGEYNNNVMQPGAELGIVGGPPEPQFKDGGNYAQMTDAAVNAQMGQPGPPQRNVITGMMSRTMVGNIEDLNIPVEEVIVTPPVASRPSTPPPRARLNYRGPRLTRFVIPNDNEDDRSTRLDSRRDPGKGRPSSSRGFTNFRGDDSEGLDKKRGKVGPFRSTFD